MAWVILLFALALAGAPSARASSALKFQPSRTVAPPAHQLSSVDAVAIGDRQKKVRAERRKTNALRALAYTKGLDRWQVSYVDGGGDERAQVLIDDRSGRVLETWTGPQVNWQMARGYPGEFAGPAEGLLVWVPLCLLFAAPFIDVRRPLRSLHFDLLALLAFSVSFAFFNSGNISASVPLVYPVLGYLFVRLLFAGVRSPKRSERLIPHVPLTLLVLAIVFLGCFRVALNISDSNVIDVGYASVIGADRIVHGRSPYGRAFPEGITRGDTYGPVNYLAYLPFVAVLGWNGHFDSPPAAHAAAIAFDLLTMLGLFLLGKRMRAGPAGTQLGAAFSFAWASYPFTLLTLNSNTNDSLVALLLVGALLALTSGPGRGALIGLAAAAKFAPFVLAPLFATAERPGKLSRRSLWSSAALAAVVTVAFLPFIPHGGLGALYDRTVGFQAHRNTPFSIWGQFDSLAWLLAIVRVSVIALALGLAFVPRRKGTLEVAALAAALLIGVQLCLRFWFYSYIVWFAPLAFVALLGRNRPAEARAPAAPAAGAQAPLTR